MEKRLIFLGLIIGLFLISFVAAAEQTGEAQATGTAQVTSFREASNKILSQDVTIPENLQTPARMVFGLNIGEQIDFQIFVILFALLIILLLVVHEILEIIPIFGSRVKSWIGAIIVTLLASVTGAVKQTALFFFDIGGYVQFLKDWGILRFLVVLIFLIILVYYGFFRLLRKIKREEEEIKAEQAGLKVGIGAALTRMFKLKRK